MWYLLAASLAVLAFNRSLAWILLAITVVLGFSQQTLGAPAILVIVLIAACGLVMKKAGEKSKVLKYAIEGVCVLIALGLMLHMIPGFHNLKVLDGVMAGPQSAPFNMYYNFDKALVPFALVAGMGSLFVANSSGKPGKLDWALLILAVPALLLVAVALGGLKIEPHLPNWLPQFILANIFFVSLAEEALFRGYLQQRLSRLMHPVLALVIMAALFGVMHMAGGLLMVIFAGLAGLIYGLAWMWSGKLWVAVLFHFGLNVIHLLFFTYPVFRHTAGV